MVGNSGDGVLALFEGGQGGLTLMSTQTEPNLPSPTDLAFSALTGGQVQFYAATAGREAADLVALNLGDRTRSRSHCRARQTPSRSSSRSEGSSLPLVAVVLTLTIEVSANELSLPLDEAGTAAPAPSWPAAGSQSARAFRPSGKGADSASRWLPTSSPPTAPARQRLVRRRCHGSGSCWDWTRFSSVSCVKTPTDSRALSIGRIVLNRRQRRAHLHRASPTGSPSAPAPPAQSGDHDGAPGSNAAETSKAVDSIIESLWNEDASSRPKRAIHRLGTASRPRRSTPDETFVWFIPGKRSHWHMNRSPNPRLRQSARRDESATPPAGEG